MEITTYVTRITEKPDKRGKPTFFIGTTDGIVLCSKGKKPIEDLEAWDMVKVTYKSPKMFPFLWEFLLEKLEAQPMGTYKVLSTGKHTSRNGGTYYKTIVQDEEFNQLFLCSKNKMSLANGSEIALIYERGKGRFANWIWNFHVC